MSSLRPVNSWIPKRVKIAPAVREKLNVTDDWYPTEPSIPFLEKAVYDHTNKDRVRAEWVRRVIELARKDCNVFTELIMDNDLEIYEDMVPYLKQSWFHREFHRLINKGMRGKAPNGVVSKYRQAAIGWPRGAGKTHQVIARVLWELGNDPNMRIKLTAETDSTASLRAHEIKTHIEKNKWVHAVFPDLKPANKEKWTETRFYIKRRRISRDPSFESYGVSGSATGGRADLLIGDDVVGRRNSLTQPKLREEVKSAWWSVWMNLLAKGGRVIYIFTSWHKDDLSHEIMTKKTWVQFIVTIGINMETPWPERWDKKELEDKYEDLGKVEFARAMWLTASNDNDVVIEEGWLQYIPAEEVSVSGLSFLHSYDLALGKSAGDYFAGTVFAINMELRKVYVVDYINKKLSVPLQMKEVSYMAEKWNPSWILIEATGYQEGLAQLLRVAPDMKGRGSTIHAIHPVTSKRLRLEMAAPEVEAKRVIFLDHLNPNCPESKKKLLVKQIVDFGIESRDDVCDSFTQGVNFIRSYLHLWDEHRGLSAQIL